ncbi:GNAT family N-acetyltransferase [Tenacibaculum caenipelagi]|uniref:RimJ/RimL family protein N-acetyltransferase n=1 Tax=Tenacibaculum caenipelagi TaxID=1325435 RepID=A0A4R6TEM1_9FLAO|nr:GNAT family N-acetyltransferase [Tenacibaculum caenipelagi]TDQ27833.1 RimJ/RimL family protein N-acetyltransferase [Tenacibaculum caenipelagi]
MNPDMANNKLHIQLRPTKISDLDSLFQFQLDKEGGYLAAFMPQDPTDKAAYINKHTKLLGNPTVNNQTIILYNTIVGSIAKFVMEGDNEITYWIDRKFWGQGIATKALKKFLTIETNRPIFGRVAFDNFGSQKVLEKCGFIKIGSDKGFANARQTEIEEFIYKLDK